MKKKDRPIRRQRKIRRAKPLLAVAAGAMLLAVAGCNDDPCTMGLCADSGAQGLPPIADMGIPSRGD